METFDYSTLFHHNPLPNWVYDAETLDIRAVNQAALDHYGYTRDEFLRLNIWDLRPPEEIPKVLAANQETREVKGNIRFGQFTHRKKDGTPIQVEVNGHRVEVGGRPCVLVTVIDVTEQVRERQFKDMTADIAAAFARHSDLGDALAALCRRMVDFGGFAFCEFWLPNKAVTQLKRLSACAGSDAGARFLHVSESVDQLSIELGLPGNVWRTHQPQIWDEVEANPHFVRKAAATEAGIKAVAGIPLRHEDTVLGVMVVGSSESDYSLRKHLDILTDIEPRIGLEIHRKKLETDLLQIFETLPDLLCMTDFNGYFLQINQAGSRMLGYAEDALVGKNFFDLVYAEDLEATRLELAKLAEGESVFRFENRYITKSGGLIWLSWHGRSVVEDGVVYATAKDITTEKNLRALLDSASELARIGAWEVNPIQGTLFWSEEMHRIYGTDPATFVPVLERDITRYKDGYRERVIALVDAAMKQGTGFEFEAPLINFQDKEVWVRAIGRTELLDGVCIRIYGSFQDITEIKATERRLQAITDDLPGVAFQFLYHPDGSTALLEVSRGSRQIWGLEPEDCEADTTPIWNQIRAGGDYGAVMQDIKQSMETRTPWRSRWRNRLPNGQMRWHEGYGRPYRLPDGSFLYNSMIFDVTERYQAEYLYQEASKLARIGSWELDLQQNGGTDQMYWSPMVKQILGVEPDYNPSLTGGFEFYAEESKVRIQAAVERLMEEGTEFDEELLTYTRAGDERWIRCIGKSERVNGVCVKIFGSFQDIHASKTTELRIGEILGSISDAFYAVDRDWTVTYFNREAERLLQVAADQVLGRTYWEVFPAAMGTALETMYRRVIEHEQSYQLEYHYPGDGSWYEVNAYPSGGGFSAYFKNIDERKKSAVALEKAFKEKISIIESIGDAFFTLDRDFTVTYWNHTAEDLLGVKRTDLVGKNLWAMFPDAVDLPSYRYYHQVLETGEPVTFEDYYGVWLEVNAYPSDQGISVFFRDITLRKTHEQELMALNEELKRSNQQLEQFAFITSHDLQEPLRMITSFLNQLDRKYADQLDDRARQYIGFATEGASRMKQVILDLLEYSRAGNPDEAALPVDLSAILDDYRILRSRIMHEKAVDLQADRLPKVVGFKAPLTQTLHALLDNAIKYAREGVPPVVKLRVLYTDEAWEFQIEDNGIGIEPQFHDKIFIIFQRLHNRDQYGGTGIGLSIAKKNIESWGGRIGLRSEPGVGTTFHFTLPKPTHA